MEMSGKTVRNGIGNHLYFWESSVTIETERIGSLHSRIGGCVDKKMKRKWIPAVCFVIACGIAGLLLHYGQRRNRMLVSEYGPERLTPYAESSVPTEGAVKQTETELTDMAEQMLYVHLCGAVKEEGVYRLPEGSRLQDGIAAAGGFRTDADTVYHNLAALLKDGQKIYVPTTDETKTISVEERAGETDARLDGEKNESQPVNLNTADLEQLMTLSGIGEAKAESILKYREKVGSFQKIEELMNVSGIGEAMFERIKEDIVAE